MASKREKLADRIQTETVNSGGGKTLGQRVEKSKVKTKSFVVDLRIHSPASLGYMAIEGIDTAPALVRLAKVKGLDMIAVTDFYSGKFVDRIVNAARDSSLVVIPGVVIRCRLGSCDDVILSCFFKEDFTTQGIESFLAALKIPESAFGNRKFLVQMSFEQILQTVKEYDGVVLPSRMDKTPHRMAALPELVEKYGFRAFDLAYADSVRFFRNRWPKVKFQLFSFSNANALAQVGSRIARVKMPEPSFAGIKSLVERVEA